MKSFIGNLKMAHKFLLIGAVAAAMLAVPSTLIVISEVAKLRFAQSELAGIGPEHDALRLVHLTQQHRGVSAGYLGGNESLAAARQAKQVEVEQALTTSKASIAKLGDPKLVALSGRIATEWQALAGGVGSRSVPGPQSFARHTALINAQLALIEDISNVSGIVLHPEASGYFLQSGVLTHLPRLTESLGQLRARGAVLLARGVAAPEEKAHLEALVTESRAHHEDARKALELALESNSALGQVIATPLAAAKAATDEGLKLVDDKIVHAATLSHSSADYFAATTRVIDAQFALIDAAFKSLDDLLQDDVVSARNQLIMVFVSIAVLAALALWLMRTVTRAATASVAQAVGAAERIAAGDLTGELKAEGRDETAQLLQALANMKYKLAGIVGDVRSNADGVATASAQIAQGNQDLSSRTEEQASALEETAASMEQLSSTVKQNADNARQANQLALGASTVAVKGGAVVGQVVDTMKGINDSSKKIADIISVIDSIAFQTNILALNAAVEAARAGEQGRGFAVVASEVRSLAQRSADAAKEIKTLISVSVERVEQGTSLVDQAGATMNEIVTAIKRVTDIMGEISSASTEQSAGVAQVGEAITQMDRATQQNAALVEQSAAAAESLKGQAAQLVQAVAVFKLAEGDVEQRPAPSAARRSATDFAPAKPHAFAIPAATKSPKPSGAALPVERRGPNRAQNVTRPAFGANKPAAGVTPPSSQASPAVAAARTGTDDEWTTF